jgi:hypothetical protein
MHTTTINLDPVTVTHRFKAGDTVSWSDGFTRTVEAVVLFPITGVPVYRFTNGIELTVGHVDGSYQLVKPKPTPLPEQWMNVYAWGVGNDCDSRAEADDNVSAGRIAILHMWTDADDGTDHAEIIRTDGGDQ